MYQSSRPLESFQISKPAEDIQERLSAKIQIEILKQDGKIPFSQFMQMALYEPGLGYYQNNLHKFGEKGDFITAPEMGNNFARCLANSVCQLFQSPSQTLSAKQTYQNIVEIGAGSGVLAANLLIELEKLGALPLQYLILEPSAALQHQQKAQLTKKIPELIARVSWISQLPDNFDGFIIANEVLDAIPFERIQRSDNKWLQLGVELDNESFIDCRMESIDESLLPPILVLSDSAEAGVSTHQYSNGYITEYRPLVKSWIKMLAKSLNKGAIMLIDYGYAESEYYHPQRSQGSLTCFIDHHSHSDPFQYVGIQDITAHVDFTEVARSSVQSNLEVSGYTTQAGFLLENGITKMADEISENDADSEEQRYQRSQELQKLLMPGQMGEVIKVILLSKDLDIDIKGFTLQDHLHRL